MGLGNESTSGCEAEDFAGFTPGRVALIQRGGCSFRLKAELAEAAGAVGTLIFNQGDEQARTQLHGGSLGSTNTLAAPVVMLPYARGEALAEAAAVQDTHATIIADTGVLDTPTFNLIAETPGGDPQAEVMLGAHLDSVPAGPGINDNGTGTALVLELARGMAGCSPRQKVRFAWWGGEEWGLKGSQAWVEALDEDALERIALYLNFDMVASPNYVRFVHDGSNGPEGSALIYAAFLDYFAAQGLATLPLAFEGNSDFQPFVDAGVPTGGLFTGAGGDKSVAEVEAFGGAGAAAYDSCYHQACDDRENVDLEVFAQNLAAAATVLEGLAGDLGELARDGALAEVGEGSALREGTVGVEVGAHEHAGCGHPLR
nr:M28 family peptidase [Pseudenhygromyxa sp. WMMC2535]